MVSGAPHARTRMSLRKSGVSRRGSRPALSSRLHGSPSPAGALRAYVETGSPDRLGALRTARPPLPRPDRIPAEFRAGRRPGPAPPCRPRRRRRGSPGKGPPCATTPQIARASASPQHATWCVLDMRDLKSAVSGKPSWLHAPRRLGAPAPRWPRRSRIRTENPALTPDRDT